MSILDLFGGMDGMKCTKCGTSAKTGCRCWARADCPKCGRRMFRENEPGSIAPACPDCAKGAR